MAENLHYEESHKAGVLRWQQKLAADALKLANYDQKNLFEKQDALVKSGGLTESDHAKALESIDKVRNAQNAYDANLWRAQQHKDEHLDQYIEEARQEAEAQGVQINLEPPKE